MIKVLLVDNERILCESLKLIIEQDTMIEVIGIAGNGFDAVEMSEKLCPDVILMDLKMPVCNGVESTKMIKQSSNPVKIIIMTTLLGNDNIAESILGGVDGYITKDISPEELILAIKSAYIGLNVFNSVVFRALGIIFEQSVSKKKYFGLSEKEILILKLVTEGKDNSQIAESINLSAGRVANIISNLVRKFNVENRICLAVFAIKNGLVSL